MAPILAAILVGVVVAFAAFVAVNELNTKSTTISSHDTVTTTLTSTLSNKTTVMITTTSDRILCNVTFLETPQSNACNLSYVVPWSVTIANVTKAQPANATLPVSENRWSAGTEYGNMSKVTFFLPNGSYDYDIHPSSAFSVHSGTITVDGATVLVSVPLPFFPCTTTTISG